MNKFPFEIRIPYTVVQGMCDGKDSVFVRLSVCNMLSKIPQINCLLDLIKVLFSVKHLWTFISYLDFVPPTSLSDYQTFPIGYLKHHLSAF